MKTQKFWIVLLGGIFLFFAGCSLYMFTASQKGSIARFYLEGVCVREIDLHRVTKPFTFVIRSKAGSNTIQVEPGRVRVLSADCPHQTCVHQGWTCGKAFPLVCLPHRLVIQIEENNTQGGPQVDGVSR